MKREKIGQKELFRWEFEFNVQDDGIEYIHHLGYEQRGICMVTPGVSDELLNNPGIGYQTFNRFNGDCTYPGYGVPDDTGWGSPGDGSGAYKKWFVQGGTAPVPESERTGTRQSVDYPESSTAYFRWYWAHFEPEKGKYRWDIMDWALEQAGKNGQVVQLRLMPHDSVSTLPEWYKKEGKVIKAGNRDNLVPDYSDPLFRDATEKMVHAIGEKYDGHPLLDMVDIGTLGYWGEWHLGLGTKMIDKEGLHWAVDIYFDAFPKTPLCMLVGNIEALAYAVSKGAGWRGDCWGDQRYGSWSHMLRRYPRNVVRAGAVDAWKNGPVSLETCGTMLTWFNKGFGVDYDIDYTLSEAVRWHASTINNKSYRVPEPWQKAVDESRKKLGYRYELREIAYPKKIKKGEPWVLDQWWVNSGNAPCYRDIRLVLRLKGSSGNFDMELPYEMKTWLPGDDQCPADRLVLPHDVPCGTYEIQLAVVLAGEKDPFILPANHGLTQDGWLRIGPVEVTE